MLELAAYVAQADQQTLYDTAVADRLAGRPAAAVPKLRQVLASRPDDVDARLNLGLALLALHRIDEAADAFREVLVRAPDYTDAYIGLARAEQRRGNLAAARLNLAEALRRAPQNQDALALSIASRPGTTWRANLNALRSRLSAGLPDWTELRLSSSRALDDRWTTSGAVEVTRRFDNSDTYLEARADRVFDGGAAWVSAGGSPDADYRPEIAVAGGGRRDLIAGLALTIEGSAARYRSGVVTGLHPGLAADLADGRLQVSGRWINVRDETGKPRQGYSILARWQATDHLALRGGLADAPESSEGTTVDVSAWSAGFDLDLSERLVLRAGYLAEDREAYDREELSAGIGWRF